MIKKKPYKARKIFKRKSGGGKFWMTGRKGGSGGGRFFSPVATATTETPNLVKVALQKLGFRVGAR